MDLIWTDVGPDMNISKILYCFNCKYLYIDYFIHIPTKVIKCTYIGISNNINTYYSYLPANDPQMNVPQNGVFVLESTFAKMLNNNPSDAIEYNILGNGKSVPIIL